MRQPNHESDEQFSPMPATFEEWLASVPVETEAQLLDRLNDRLNDEYTEWLESDDCPNNEPMPAMEKRSAA